MLNASTIILNILDIWNDKLGQKDCLVDITKPKIVKGSFQRLKLIIKVLHSMVFYFYLLVWFLSCCWVVLHGWLVFSPMVLTNISVTTAILASVHSVRLHINFFC